MTAAAETGVAGDVQVFRHQAGLVRAVVRMNLDGITHEESLLQPSPGGNCLNWVVGHLTCVYNNVLPLLGQEPVMDKGALKRYDRGAPPLTDAAEAMELGTLLDGFQEACDRIDAGLATLSADALDRPAPFSPGNDPDETVRSLVSTVLFHQTYHAGQLGILRRLAGKEGAIR